jgi:ATP phosphoribosyltransferase
MREHNLKIIATLLESSTCFVANLEALKDEWKAEKVAQLAMLFQAIIDARSRVMLEMNVAKEKLDAIVKELPCMRSPTIAQLYGEQGYAVKVAVGRAEAARLIPRLKRLGAADILEYEFRKVII